MTQSAPTLFHPGDGSDFYEIIAMNDGAAATEGPTMVSDTLPAGVTVTAARAYVEVLGFSDTSSHVFELGCGQTSEGATVTVTCTTESSVPVGRAAVVKIDIQVPPGASGRLSNTATVSGGGAPDASVVSATEVTESAEPIPFGASLTSEITGANGDYTQAGGHPFAFTTLLRFNVGSVSAGEECNEIPICAAINAQAKDIETIVPPGLVGNPTAMPYCTLDEFEKGGNFTCPPQSQVGALYLYFYGSGTAVQYAPVYNIEPPPGEPAELGFTVAGAAHIPLFFHVRSDGDYGLTADLTDINQFDPVRIALLSIWGEPTDPAHDPLRLSDFGNCGLGTGGCASGVFPPKPFLRLPTSCPGGSLPMSVLGDSWQASISPLPQLAESSMAGTTGCEALPFDPEVSVTPSTRQAGAPVGYDVHLSVPQSEEVGRIETADIRDTEVTLPEGTVLSPSAANGLSACSDEQFGLHVEGKSQCPRASKIGTVSVTTPLLSKALTGSVFVGAPECSPCSTDDARTGRMTRLFVEAEGSGVIIKQAGRTRIDQSTERLVTVFTDMPQDPVSDISLSLEQGPNAPLVNPGTCGAAITTASMTPWSSMTASEISAPAVTIEGCTTPGFAPSFAAGRTTNARAGAFTGFAVSLSRNDGEQTLGSVSVTTPPGLLGVLKSVEQCAEGQANAGTCSEGSLIGSGSIVVGPGSAPLRIRGAKVFLTGPYEGNPFGLSIVTPAVAGPFVLSGNTGNGIEVVRASVAVDPHTSAITVSSDPLPQALNGVPLDVRKVDITIDREGFMFNPTNCDAMAVSGTITSAVGTASNVSFPLQATDCGILPFKPTFTVSTQGKASKKNGASLHVHVTSSAGQANIAKVKVNLPIQLPSRLSTLQKACVDHVFEANPGSCPAVSIVGRATAVTPLLAKPLTGPAYLVSHAAAAFPDLEIVLQGEGITLILDGNTTIKRGITSSIFKTVPDAPISSFDLVLPQGPHSVLAAFGSLCTGKLKMPTVITGQNGAVVRQTTKIAATGCPKHKKANAASSRKKR